MRGKMEALDGSHSIRDTSETVLGSIVSCSVHSASSGAGGGTCVDGRHVRFGGEGAAPSREAAVDRPKEE